MKRIVIRTERELKIVRAHLRRRKLRRLHRWFERWTIPILWAILLITTGLFVTYMYILPMRRIANEGFGLGLYGPQTYESILEAVTVRVGEPVYEREDTEEMLGYKVFTTTEQRVTVFRTTENTAWLVIRSLEGLDIEPRTSPSIVTDRGITTGSSFTGAYSAYKGFGVEDLLEVILFSDTIESIEDEGISQLYYVSDMGNQYRHVALDFDGGKLTSIHLGIIAAKSYSERLWTHYSNARQTPYLVETVFIASAVVPSFILLFFLSFGMRAHRPRLWLLWLFGFAPYPAVCLWPLALLQVRLGADQNMFLALFLFNATPLLAGIYVAITLGFRVWREPLSIDIPVISHITNWLTYPNAMIKGGICAIAVAILVLLCSIPAALFIVALLPF